MPPKQKNTCFECEGNVNNSDKALMCNICEQWYHAKCQRVTNAEYEFLSDKPNESIQWYCKSCRGASLKLFKIVTVMHKRQEELEKQVTDIRQDINKCNTKLDNQSQVISGASNKISEIEQNLPAIISRKMVSLLDDRVEEEKREENLIFFNVPETDAREQDEEFIRELCDEALGLDMRDVAINEMVRLGAKPKTENDKSRPVRLVIKDRDKRADILRNAHKLKDADKDLHKKVGINKDLTKSQREQRKTLRSKLNKLKLDFPNKKWAIRRDEVVEITHGPGFPQRGDQRGGRQ